MNQIISCIDTLITNETHKQFCKQIAYSIQSTTSEYISLELYVSFLNSRTKLLTMLDIAGNTSSEEFKISIESLGEDKYHYFAKEPVAIFSTYINNKEFITSRG